MNLNIAASSLVLLLISVFAQQIASPAGAKDSQSQAPVEVQGTTSLPPDTKAIGGLAAPGADALMTPDLLLVNPQNQNAQPPQPLKAYIGVSLTMKVERTDIRFDRLQGILITVVNETNRPLVVNGEKAQAIVGEKTYQAAPVSALQNIVIPPHKADQVLEDIVTKIVPAAATVGIVPTVKDMNTQSKPVLQRYGPDEVRRRVESSRFGRRVLWPRAKTSGVIYFDTRDTLDSARVEIPASTLFDMSDAGLLVSSAPAK